MFHIDNSKNDAPYQGIHIFKNEQHILTFWEDDAPVHEFNALQHQWAGSVVNVLNSMDRVSASVLIEGLSRAEFIKRKH